MLAEDKRATGRRIAWIVFSALVILCGLAMIVVCASFIVVGTLNTLENNGSVGIIGGADGATAEYLVKKYNDTMGQILKFGALVVITGIVSLTFNRFFSRHCGVETSVTAISISAVVGLGLNCVMLFAFCSIFDHPKNHPIRYPASFFLGVICLVIFLVLIGFYVFFRFRRPSLKGTLIVWRCLLYSRLLL